MFRIRRLLIGFLILSPLLVAFSSASQAAEQRNSTPWWVWVLIVALLAPIIWWWLGGRAKEKADQGVKVKAATPALAPSEVEQPTPDDLKRIEGIGPKISGLLQAAGITTFAQLAGSDVDRLKQIVRDAGITIANPSTWPEQASLAAAGKWDELEVLQGELKGGRRV